MTNYRKLVIYSIVVSMMTFLLSLSMSPDENVVGPKIQTASANTNTEEPERLSYMPETAPSNAFSDFLEMRERATNESEKVVADVGANPAPTMVAYVSKPKTIEYVKVNVDYLNVRKDANTSSKILDVLVKGWVLEVIEVDDNGWIQLEDGGFINGKYTDKVEASRYKELLKKQESQPKPKPTFYVPVKETVVKAANINTSKNERQPATAKVASSSTTVSNKSVSGYNAGEIDLLARLVRAEAQNESYQGKVAVAMVVLNRIDSGQFPGTIESVIYQPGQFSPVSNGAINRAADSESIRAVKEALTSDRGLIGDSLFFYNAATATSRWLDGRPTTVVIGNHTFKR